MNCKYLTLITGFDEFGQRRVHCGKDGVDGVIGMCYQCQNKEYTRDAPKTEKRVYNPFASVAPNSPNPSCGGCGR